MEQGIQLRHRGSQMANAQENTDGLLNHLTFDFEGDASVGSNNSLGNSSVSPSNDAAKSDQVSSPISGTGNVHAERYDYAFKDMNQTSESVTSSAGKTVTKNDTSSSSSNPVRKVIGKMKKAVEAPSEEEKGSSTKEIADAVKGDVKVRKVCFIVWAIIGCCILTGVVIYLMQILAIPVAITIWTLVFVFCLRGIVNELEEHHINRLIGTTISYIIMFLVLGIIAVLMFSPVFGLNNQFADIISNIPGYIEAIREWMDGLYQNYGHWLNNEAIQNFVSSAEKSMSDWSSSLASGAANAVMGFGTTVANSFMAIGFALVIAFWILLELPAIGAETRRIISPKFVESAEFLHITFTRIMGGYLKGTLAQCFIIGLGCGILFAVLKIPNAPALGVITGIMNIIPIIGPWIGGAIAAISAIFVSPITALIAILGTIVIQQFVYTFISPKIMQSSVDVHPALTLMAMMIGSAVGGAMSGIMGSLVGMLFSIPAVAVIRSCFIFYFERHTGRKIVADDGVLFKGSPSDGDYVNPLMDATSGTGKRQLSQLKRDRDAREHENKVKEEKQAAKDAKKAEKKEMKEKEKI